MYSLPNIVTKIKGWWLLEHVARMDTMKRRFVSKTSTVKTALGVLDVDERNIIVSWKYGRGPSG